MRATPSLTTAPARARSPTGPTAVAGSTRRRRASTAGACRASASTRCPSRSSRCSLRSVTASNGDPCDSALRVFTSHTTSTSPSRATMSISPMSQRQLRSRITYPSATRWSAARSSPYLPSASLARTRLLPAPAPIAPLLRPRRASRRVHGAPDGQTLAADGDGRRRGARVLGTTHRGWRRAQRPASSGIWSSGLASSSTLTSLKVSTRTFFTKRAGRYMSHTQASVIRTSK